MFCLLLHPDRLAQDEESLPRRVVADRPASPLCPPPHSLPQGASPRTSRVDGALGPAFPPLLLDARARRGGDPVGGRARALPGVGNPHALRWGLPALVGGAVIGIPFPLGFRPFPPMKSYSSLQHARGEHAQGSRCGLGAHRLRGHLRCLVQVPPLGNILSSQYSLILSSQYLVPCPARKWRHAPCSCATGVASCAFPVRL